VRGLRHRLRSIHRYSLIGGILLLVLVGGVLTLVGGFDSVIGTALLAVIGTAAALFQVTSRSGNEPWTAGPAAAGPTVDTGRPAVAPAGSPWMVPPRRGIFIPRPQLTQRLIETLVDARPGVVGLLAALRGAGGVGKTTLAEEVSRRPEIRARFPGGLLWVTLGKETAGAELASKINDLSEILSGRRPSLADPELAGAHLGELLGGRPRLLVIDDVWRSDQLRPFLYGQNECVRLVTTRTGDVLPDDASVLTVDVMEWDEAAALLTAGVTSLSTSVSGGLVRLTGRWPVLLGLVNHAVRRMVRDGLTVESAARQVEQRLVRYGPTVLDMRRPTDRSQAVAATLEASLGLLQPDELARYLELAIFPEDTDVPLEVLRMYWSATAGLDADGVAALCDNFADLSLVDYHRREPPAVRLHDVVRAYLRHRCGPARLADMNAAFLGAARATLPPAALSPGPAPWWLLPGEARYLWQALTYHLVEAGARDELISTVCEIRYLAAKLTYLGPVAVQADLVLAEHPLATRLRYGIGRAARLLAPTDPEHALVGILLSRLAGDDELEPLLDSFAASLTTPRLANRWLPPDLPHPALRQVLRGQARAARGCVVGPDGRWLASGDANGAVRIRDLATGDLGMVLDGHTAAVWACAVTSDGRRLVSSGDDQTVRCWDLTSGRATTLTGHAASVWACTVSPDGDWAASGDANGSVRVWDLASGLARGVLSGHAAAVWTCTASPDATWLATGGEDRTVLIWDVASGETVARLAEHEATVWSSAVSPDGSLLVTGDASGAIRIWDTTSWTARAVLRSETGGVWACPISPDGSWLATGDVGGSVRIWDLATGEQRAEFHGHNGAVLSLAISPDGGLAVSGDSSGDVRVWEVASDQAQVVPSHAAGIQACAISPDGSWLVTGDVVGEVRVWDVRAERVHRRLAAHQADIWACPVSPDGRWLASGGDDGKVHVWDIATGRRETTFDHPAAVWACAIGPDGSWLVTADAHGTVRIWDVASGQVRSVLEGHADGGVWYCAIGPDGTWLASAGDDGTVRIWDIATARTRAVLRHGASVWACAIGPAGDWLASAGADGSIRIWDVATAQPRAVLDGHVGGVWWASPSPCGRLLATVGDDTAVRIWDVADERLLVRLDGHAAGAWTCEFSPDGSWLASGDTSGTAIIWDTATWTVRTLLAGHPALTRACAAGPDGSWLAGAGSAGDGTGSVHLRDTATGAVRAALVGHTDAVRACVVSPDGTWLATAGDDATARIWDLATGAAEVLQHDTSVWACALSPGGDLLVTADADGRLTTWDVATRRRTGRLEGHPRIRACAISPDGRWLATGGDDGTVRRWDLTGGPPPAVLGRHAAGAWACAISPDGRLLASADATGAIQLRDPADPARYSVLSGHSCGVRACAISPDGRLLASADVGGTIRVWDLVTRRGETMTRVEGPLYDCRWLSTGPDLCAAGANGLYLFTYVSGRR
jgi:WD40 repeat protein